MNENKSFEITEPEETDPIIGRRVGAYEIVREIGAGGMGTVYLATRADGMFQKQVAVKLVRRGTDTKFVLRRFRQERQILAALNHPFIAKLIDGGTTADGLPYFVMEYVAGESLYRHSDNQKLSINDRLKLFQNICEAVDYAHENKVIHRDLKPSNVLVKPDGTPRLLDFGIAKVLDPELEPNTIIDPTQTAMRLMTPEYASPEQIKGEPVSPTSDTYSLGILLYELLTGHRPYRFKNRALHELARVICEEEPERPSAGITREDNFVPTGNAATLESLYRSRGSGSLKDLQKELAGDLERVILKALRKEPAERYQTARGFAADIGRYLEGKPVAAPPVETSFSQNPQSAAKSIAVLPLKILNLAPSRDTGEDFLSVGLADAIITRLTNVRSLIVRPTSAVLRYGDETFNPVQAGGELAVDFVLDGRIKIAGRRIRVSLQMLDVKKSASIWANQFDEDFTDALELEDSISNRVAEAILPQMTATEKQKIRERGTNHPLAFEAYMRGRYFWNQFTPDSLPKALGAFETAVALDPNYALAYVGLADFYIWANIYGILPSSEATTKADEAARRAITLDDRLGEAYASLGLVESNRRNWAESEKLYLRALELNPNYVHAHEWYAAWLVGLGETERGVAKIKRAEHLDPLSLRTKTLTAWTLHQAHRFDEALARCEQIIDLDKNYPQGYLQKGLNLLQMGRTEEALANLQKFDRMIPQLALAKYPLCFALVAAGQESQAKAVLEELKTLAARIYVKPYYLAMAHAALDERDEAFVNFEKSFAEPEGWLLWFETEPLLEKLCEDARYQKLVRRIENPLALKTSAD